MDAPLRHPPPHLVVMVSYAPQVNYACFALSSLVQIIMIRAHPKEDSSNPHFCAWDGEPK